MDLTAHAARDDSDQLADLQRKQEDQEQDDDDEDSKPKKGKTTTSTSTSNQIDTSYYDYLINMSLRNLTKERRDEILKDRQEKLEKLEALKKKTPEDLYDDDLHNFETEYRKVCSSFLIEKLLYYRSLSSSLGS